MFNVGDLVVVDIPEGKLNYKNPGIMVSMRNNNGEQFYIDKVEEINHTGEIYNIYRLKGDLWAYHEKWLKLAKKSNINNW